MAAVQLPMQMDPLFLSLSLFRRRKLEECVEVCTQMLQKNPYDQAAWCLKTRALTEQVYVDEVDVDEEGIAEMLMDDNAVAQLPRPGTSLKKPGTSAGGGGPTPGVRPMSQAGRPVSGFVRPGTQSGRPGTMEQAIRTPRTAQTARPVTSASGRYVRLGTASMLAQPDGPFINISKLNLPKYAQRPNLAKEEESSHSELMISAGFESDDDMKPSKIPQRIKDGKSASHSHASENGLDSFRNDKLDKSLSDSRKDRSGRGSPDRTIGSDDDDIFSDFLTKPKSSLQANKTKKEPELEKMSLDSKETAPKAAGGLSSLKNAPPLSSGGGGLGSLKDAPPLPGTTKTSKEFPKSPDWNDLAEIDSRINKLGFDIPGEEKSTHSQEYEYEDDFQASSSHLSDHSLSLTEEIEEQLSSYHSNSSKADDPLTTDRTVSHASDNGLDYAEDILDDF